MVFCKLSDNVKKKLNDVEIDTEKFINETKKKINENVQNNIKKLEENKKKIDNKILERKKSIERTIIRPYKAGKNRNKAIMFVIDICILIALGLFTYKMYPFIKQYLNKESYDEKQFNEAKKLPESAFSKEELRKVQEFRKSYQDWLDYYKQESAFSDSNLGKFEIQMGNLLRSPFLLIIQYVVPYIIVAYIIWFIIKYIKYVIAAIWGFFIACYQYVTRKITCTLAQKWYIRLITGWSRCSPSFSGYLQSWQNNYINRPIAEERISYLRGIEVARQQYQLKYGGFSPYKYGFNILSGWLDWLKNLKLVYIDLPLNELYLQIIDFHPNYVVRPYTMFGEDVSKKTDKIKGDAYPSKTKKGKVCKCPPRKTLYKKLNNYLTDIPKKATQLSDIAATTKRKVKEVTINTANKVKDTDLYDNVSDVFDKVTSCDSYDTVLNKTIQNKKNIGKVAWITMFTVTAGIVAFSMFYQYPNWVKNLISPAYSFINGYVPTQTIQGVTMSIGIVYIGLFLYLGYYSFFKK